MGDGRGQNLRRIQVAHLLYLRTKSLNSETHYFSGDHTRQVVSEREMGSIMSATLVVRHTVADYATWRRVYDEVETIRAEHGCVAEQVLRDPGDANDVFITHEFASVGQAEAFAQDAKFGAAMQRAGVTSAPRVEIVQSV